MDREKVRENIIKFRDECVQLGCKSYCGFCATMVDDTVERILTRREWEDCYMQGVLFNNFRLWNSSCVRKNISSIVPDKLFEW